MTTANDTRELALRGNSQLAILDGALSVAQLVQQRELILGAMKNAMIEGQHYGKIAGCGDKPSLLQPGAQLLCTLFRLRPEYEIFETTLAHDHKTYRVTCRLYLMGTEPAMHVGEGVGEASSMESKHRYRNAAAEIKDTGDELPKAYWQMRESQGDDKAKAWLANAYDGRKVGPKKIEGVWRVVEFMGGGEEKIENANPTDVHNTVLKMAKKRAFVDATITATASNDAFTQDLEDIRGNLDAIDVITSKVEKPAQTPRGDAEPVQGGKTAEKPKGGQERTPAKPDGVQIDDWRKVVVHFGKENGPIKGKQLGELPGGKLEWLRDNYAGKTTEQRKKMSADDKRLEAALLVWDAEKNGKKAPVTNSTTKTEAPASDEDERSANLESLATNLDFGGIPTDVFLKVAAAKGWTNAKEFGGISNEDARKLVERVEDVVSACQAEMK